ncbi:DUF6538 domain-containing protein [Nitrospirillum sp. BR 11164]|uniref:DUF6538 domain-containing protein n=1 Tax=Nitrospirillum sp. BR 11164 TaxID=3104324 RepID=UPI002AFDDECD|nr:DUF6538 domain-containing protein [Nitrospirillum sp. BR 11164]MEA1648412.1 DUF6538 domain-containing protein [Nitrospirillum sp. BR 11164]
MPRIPYTTLRRQTYFLKVRTPADLLPLLRRRHHVESLKTANPREARDAVPPALARLRRAWHDLRMDILAALGKRLDSMSLDELQTIPLEDLAALSSEDRTRFAATFDARLQGKVEAVYAQERQGETLRVHARELKDVMAALERQEVLAKTLNVAVQNGAALKKGFELWLASRDLLAAQAETAVAVGRELRTAMGGQPDEAPAIPAPSWDSHWARFLADRPGIGEGAQVSYQQAFRELAALIGTKPIGAVTKADITRFAQHLRDKPINRTGRSHMSLASIKKLLGHVKTYFKWAVGVDLITTDPTDGVQPRAETREERMAKTARRGFRPDELKTIFNSPLFTGCQSMRRRSKPGARLYRDEPYWFFLIALATGARTEEIAALPAELVECGTVRCFDFRHATKTSAGPRLVPVLPELWSIGLDDWTKAQQRRGRKMLEGPEASADWSKWLNRYLDDIGLTDPALVAYSFRHSFRQALRAADLHPELINKVFGHEGDSVGAGYGRELSEAEAKRVIEKVKLPINLLHLRPYKRG